MVRKFCERFNLDYRFIKFLLVGALNTLFSYCVYSLLLFIGGHYAIAVIVSTVLGVLFNFKTTGVIVFKNNDNALIFKFVGVYSVTCSLNIIFLKIFDMLGFNLYFAGAILILPMALISFILMKKLVFVRKSV